jgi:hydroxymethylpyrimidine pyrophosphatase-like HAD family hydrolase
VNKASGLKAALKVLDLEPGEVVGVGDAENDHAFLSLCGCAVAVDNALPSLKEQAHFVTEGRAGAGVVQLLDLMVNGDLTPATLAQAVS